MLAQQVAHDLEMLTCPFYMAVLLVVRLLVDRHAQPKAEPSLGISPRNHLDNLLIDTVSVQFALCRSIFDLLTTFLNRLRIGVQAHNQPDACGPTAQRGRFSDQLLKHELLGVTFSIHNVQFSHSSAVDAEMIYGSAID